MIHTLRLLQNEDPKTLGSSLVSATAEAMGLEPQLVRTAVRYYSQYAHEIEERIAANSQLAEVEEARWLVRADSARKPAAPSL